MRVDVLDLGSHTFHVISVEVEGGEIEPIHRAKLPVRLGEQVFRDGRIGPGGARASFEAIRRLLAGIPRGGDRLEIVATSAFREAVDGKTVIEEVERRFGAPARILSGTEEARLTFAGIRSEMEDDSRIAAFDLGGGSLECMFGEEALEISRTLPLGALRLKERWLGETGVPDEAALEQLRDVIRDAAEPVVRAIRRAEPDEVVFSSGTARAILKLARRLGHVEDVDRCIGRQTVFQLAMLLSSLTPDSVQTLGVTESRADTIGVGALILATILRMMDVPFVRIASRALREGVALHAAGEAGEGRAWASA